MMPDAERVISFGLYRFAVNLGVAVGPALAGFLAEHSFFYLFAGDAATSAVFGLIALTALPHGLRTYQKGERLGEALRAAPRDFPFLVFLLARLLAAMVGMPIGSTLALHRTTLGHPPHVFGMP